VTSPRIIDRKAFAKLRRIAPAALSVRRAEQAVRATPDEVAFKLTNRCNLRCDHCYEWNEDGYHHDMDAAERNGELDIAVIAKVLEATSALASNVYLWGGEPLLYRQWDQLVDLLAAHRRWTSMCTNGLLIERRLDSLLRISEWLEIVVALDGFEAEHDALRGKGMFARTSAGLRRLVAEKRAGRFLGEITVNCVFQDAMVGRLFDFVRQLEDEGVETLYLSYPWFISPETASKMDAYVATHFPLMTLRTMPKTASWHAYTFTLSPGAIAGLRDDLARIARERWRIKLHHKPELDLTELEEFLSGTDRPAGGRTRCHALRSRLDVLPSGEAVSCKFFPEFTMGNLGRSDVASVWHGQRFEKMRSTVHTCGLMPVCSKCPMLYTRGA
jgi:radical SAM protein with 4Fe4S-binding SPASM domain